MKKNYHYYLSTIVLLCTTSYLLAAKINQQTALQVAKNFYYEVTASKNIEYDQISVSEIFDVKRDGNSVYYAFNFVNGGFVIVSADDLFTPIIGYNTEGTYSETDAPENWKWLMNEFADMIAFGQRELLETNPEYAEMWQHLTADKSLLSRGGREVIVPPLCSAMWNQNYPYNYYAPLDPKGPGKRAYAGCVATAMSIIMHYWRWPQKGTGYHSYNPNVGYCDTNYPVLSANFGATEYHFEGMANTIHTGLDNPVALLMYHCGVAVDMMYCHSGSGAFSGDVPYAIQTYFKYDNSATIYSKEDMNDQQWKNLLKTDLNKRYPIYNSGCSETGCHAFVCDGYNSDDLFHYNFGWGGSSNGYYTVNGVNGYSSWQNAIVNFIPNATQYPPSNCSEFTLVPFLEGTIADCSGPVHNYSPNISASWLIAPEDDLSKKIFTINLKELDLAQGDYLRIYDGDSETSPLLAEYTADSQPQEIKPIGLKAFIRFTTSPTSATAKGFLLNYELASVKYCNPNVTTILTEQEGTFDDGSGEDYYYPNSTTCKWQIIPNNATRIDITFNYFETEAEKDFVRIYDLTDHKLIASLSGVYTKDNLPSVSVPSGKAQIYFSSTDLNNAKGFELNYKAVVPAGIEEQNQAVEALTISPNPASTQLNLSFSISGNTNPKVEIYNMMGQNIYNENLTGFSGNYHKTINIESWAEGIYFLKITSSNGISVKKIIVN
ncbi:MAG: C10 family peptidase [Bacteroidetes bacterium]|nr:C10 family peptidase [Bacteroidota bacterium]MCL1968142.1 C10 family peptidase [Bacteroidota bacterium]